MGVTTCLNKQQATLSTASRLGFGPVEPRGSGCGCMYLLFLHAFAPIPLCTSASKRDCMSCAYYSITPQNFDCRYTVQFRIVRQSHSVKTRIHVKVRLLSLKWYFSQVDFLADFDMPFHWLLVDHPSTIPWLPIAIIIQKKLVIWVYLTNFTTGWLKYRLNDRNLTEPDFYMNSHFYRESHVTRASDVLKYGFRHMSQSPLTKGQNVTYLLIRQLC